MPVSIEFSIARRKFVSVISVLCICERRRMWRQVPSSIHTVSADSATTIQNSVLPMRPIEVRQPCPRTTRPFPDGASATSCTMPLLLRTLLAGSRETLLASTRSLLSSRLMAWRRVTSAGTK